LLAKNSAHSTPSASCFLLLAANGNAKQGHVPSINLNAFFFTVLLLLHTLLKGFWNFLNLAKISLL